MLLDNYQVSNLDPGVLEAVLNRHSLSGERKLKIKEREKRSLLTFAIFGFLTSG